jgi:2',3'-cyclic-nucleotide 2'-phosphodiesterase (5'-nucleotidase family)
MIDNHDGCGRVKRSSLLLPLLLALAALFALAPAFGAEPVRLTILHTNDMHGRLLPQETGEEKEVSGGIARIAGMAAKIREEVEAAGGHALLLDAGDIYAGTPEGNTTKGRLCIEMMNAAGYAAMCIGNHEFDDGADNIAALAKEAGFPFLCANIREKKSGKTPAYAKPYILREVGGAKIAILGVVASDTHILTGGAKQLDFLREENALKEAAAEAKQEGAVLCIALTHVGFDRDREISDALREIPLLIGGHSHTYLKKGWKNYRTGVWVVQAGCYSRHLGRVDLAFDPETGKVLSLEPALVSLSGEDVPADPKVEALLLEKSKEIRRLMDEPLGENVVELKRSGRRFSGASTPLGNVLADLMREGGNADLGFHNRTGIREILPEGKVTLRDIYKVCPFGNTIVAMDLTGKEVLEILEYALEKGNRFLLEISGATVKYDKALEPGHRVVSVWIGEKPLDPAETYRVATSNFIADGGDGHVTFKDGRNRKDTGTLLRDLFARKVRSTSPFKPEYKNRLIQIR